MVATTTLPNQLFLMRQRSALPIIFVNKMKMCFDEIAEHENVSFQSHLLLSLPPSSPAKVGMTYLILIIDYLLPTTTTA